MRNDIRRAFDDLLPSAHPALPSMVRSRLVAARKKKENVLMQRFVQFGAVVAAVIVLGVITFAFLATGGHRGTPVSKPIPVATSSPTPSPTATVQEAPTCSGTYTVSGNQLTVTAASNGGPITVNVLVSDANGGTSVRTQKLLPKGQSSIQLTLTVAPPVSRVDLVMNQNNNGAQCVATPVG